MTTVQESKVMTDTVELSANALLELLEGTSTHAGRDKTLPTLNAVQIESAGEGYLMARATDRYRLIEGKIETEYGQLSPSLIRLDDIKSIMPVLKACKSDTVLISRLGDYLNLVIGESRFTFIVCDGTFPPTAHLFDKCESEREEIGEINFNPAFFADYAKIAGKGNAVRVEFTAKGKPIIIHLPVTVVEWKALLMPMRII